MIKFINFVICVLFFAFCVFGRAEAAVFYFSPPAINMAVNDRMEVSLMLDTEGERVNAVEGDIIFSKDKLGLVDIGYEDSIVNLWVEEPRLEEDKIIFAGIIPGGFDGVRVPFQEEPEPGKILSLIFRARQPGVGSVVFEDTRALLNDGEGTETEISLLPFSVDISGKKPAYPWWIYGIIIVVIFIVFILWRKKF